MIKIRLAVSIFLLLTLPLAQAETLSGRVVRVTDGDTIVVLDASKSQHKIRLTGIDAPERGQAFGTKSKEHLSDLVAGESVVIDYNKYDRYGRTLGKVLLNGEDVNLDQVESGMAWHYKKYQGEQTPTDRVKYSEAELDAKRDMRGLWGTREPVPPWEYRKAKQGKISDKQLLGVESMAAGSH